MSLLRLPSLPSFPLLQFLCPLQTLCHRVPLSAVSHLSLPLPSLTNWPLRFGLSLSISKQFKMSLLASLWSMTSNSLVVCSPECHFCRVPSSIFGSDRLIEIFHLIERGQGGLWHSAGLTMLSCFLLYYQVHHSYLPVCCGNFIIIQ